MKKIALLFFLSIIAVGVFAQDSTYAKIKEPDFPFEPVLLNADQSSIDLSREKPEISIKQTIKVSENSYILKSPHSSFVIHQQPIKLVVKHGQEAFGSTNPKDYYKLFKMEVDEKKGTRTCRYFRTDNKNLSLPLLTVTKIRGDIYMLTLDKLEVGEYAVPAGESLYTFRIEQ